MPDMLVRLWQLDAHAQRVAANIPEGVRIRQPMGPELDMALDWVRAQFSDSWGSEAAVAAYRSPCALYLALAGHEIVGFGCYDAARLGLAGPYGVRGEFRGRGLGTALLLRTLNAMRERGYAYAIIGDVTPVEFYRKVCGAAVIDDVEPTLWSDRVRRDRPIDFSTPTRPEPSS